MTLAKSTRLQLRARAPSAVLLAALPDSLPPVLRRLYAARGVHANELALELSCLLPVGGLKGIAEAATLLADAVVQQRRIIVAGDYDCDGATGCALAVLGLRALGAAPVGYVVPDRFLMGYGLSPALTDLAIKQGAELLLTVDNGIASLAGVAHAKACGLTVIVTDHHLPGAQLPAADAIVNPNQPGCTFASKALAGVGVMFYLLLAVRAQLRVQNFFGDRPLPKLTDFLDLVALGTVADLVRLDANNRVLVEQGLRRIRDGRARPGITALLEAGGRKASQVTATDLGFVVGPRLNAAGRLEDMRAGIECLLAEQMAPARAMALALDKLNRERRTLQTQMSEQALELTQEIEAIGICTFDPGWHEGVVGLVASKLKDAHHRPTIAFARAQQSGWLKGSARSISGLHVRDALAAVDARNPGLIDRFGGHAMAAGLSLREADYERFAASFDAVCREWLTPVQLEQIVETDGPLADAELSLSTARVLEQAGPWGQGFPEPIFEGRFTVASVRLMGSEQQHVRYRLRAAGSELEAVDFGGAERAVPAGQAVQLAYQLSVNRYDGRESAQLRVVQLEPAS